MSAPMAARGARGAPGQDGAPGLTPDVQVGTVITETGDEARVEITRSGTGANVVLNFKFTLPAGGTLSLEVGTVTTLEPGDKPWVTITPQGSGITFEATTTTLDPGSEATVNISEVIR